MEAIVNDYSILPVKCYLNHIIVSMKHTNTNKYTLNMNIDRACERIKLQKIPGICLVFRSEQNFKGFVVYQRR